MTPIEYVVLRECARTFGADRARELAAAGGVNDWVREYLAAKENPEPKPKPAPDPPPKRKPKRTRLNKQFDVPENK